MSKKKSPSIPEPPQFQADPNVEWSQNTLRGEVPKLLGLSGLPEGLMEAINTNPQVTALTLQRLESQLSPAYRNSRQNVINQLEANNQLTGSTTASALGNLESDYLAQLTAAGAEAGIQDIGRALSNRMTLYGLGLNTAGAVGNTGLNNQEQMNNFALSNYENQVAAALMSQPKQTGGFMGALTGAVGGGLGGFAIGGPIGAAVGAGVGGLAGGLGSPGSGGQFLGAGASLYGNRQMSSSLSTFGGNESIYNPIYQPTGNGFAGGLVGNGSNYARSYFGF